MDHPKLEFYDLITRGAGCAIAVLQQDRRLIADRSVGTFLIVVSAPVLHLFPCVGKTEEPVGVGNAGSCGGAAVPERSLVARFCVRSVPRWAPVARPRRGGRLHARVPSARCRHIDLAAARCARALPAYGRTRQAQNNLSDNGTELTSNVILQWADDHKVVCTTSRPPNRCRTRSSRPSSTVCGMSYLTRRYSARSRIHASRSKLGVPTTTLCALILGSDG